MADPPLDDYRKKSLETGRRWPRSGPPSGSSCTRIAEDVNSWLIDQLAPAPGDTVLELAAGTGETGFQAARERGRLRQGHLDRLLARDGRDGALGGEEQRPSRTSSTASWTPSTWTSTTTASTA